MPAIPAPTTHTSAFASDANASNRGISKPASHGDKLLPDVFIISAQRARRFVQAKPEEKRDCRDCRMEPRVGHIVCDQPEEHPVPLNEAKNCYQPVNNPKDPKEKLACVCARRRACQSDHAGQ